MGIGIVHIGEHSRKETLAFLVSHFSHYQSCSFK